jgi:hypothetical protein
MKEPQSANQLAGKASVPWKLNGRGTGRRIYTAGDYSIELDDGAACRGIPPCYRVYHLDGDRVKKIGAGRTLTEAKALACAHQQVRAERRESLGL